MVAEKHPRMGLTIELDWLAYPALGQPRRHWMLPPVYNFMFCLRSKTSPSRVNVFPPNPFWKRFASSWLMKLSTDGSQHKLTVLPST